MKKIYSIGYTDSYGSFTKVWDKGYTRKFVSIEEAKEYLEERKQLYKENSKNIKIMQGWKVIEEVELI